MSIALLYVYRTAASRFPPLRSQPSTRPQFAAVPLRRGGGLRLNIAHNFKVRHRPRTFTNTLRSHLEKKESGCCAFIRSKYISLICYVYRVRAEAAPTLRKVHKLTRLSQPFGVPTAAIHLPKKLSVKSAARTPHLIALPVSARLSFVPA